MARTKGAEALKKFEKATSHAAAAAAAAATAASRGALSPTVVQSISAAVAAALRASTGHGGAAASSARSRNTILSASAFLSRYGYYTDNAEWIKIIAAQQDKTTDEVAKEAALSLRNSRAYVSKLTREVLLELFLDEGVYVQYLKDKAKRSIRVSRPQVSTIDPPPPPFALITPHPRVS